MTDANVVLGYLPTELAGGEIALDLEAARTAVQTIADATGLDPASRPPRPGSSTSSTRTCSARCAWSRCSRASTRATSRWSPSAAPARCTPTRSAGSSGPGRSSSRRRPGCSTPTATRRPACATRRPAPSSAGSPSCTDDEPARDPRRARRDGARHARRGRASPPTSRPSPTQVDLRYHGQGFEIPIDVDLDAFDGAGGGLAALRKAFDAEHERLFSFLLADEHEVVNVRAPRPSGPRPTIAGRPAGGGRRRPVGRRTCRTTQVWVDGGPTTRASTTGLAARAGNVVPGPADRRRDGLHHPRAPRPRRDRPPQRQPPHPPVATQEG